MCHLLYSIGSGRSVAFDLYIHYGPLGVLCIIRYSCFNSKNLIVAQHVGRCY